MALARLHSRLLQCQVDDDDATRRCAITCWCLRSSSATKRGREAEQNHARRPAQPARAHARPGSRETRRGARTRGAWKPRSPAARNANEDLYGRAFTERRASVQVTRKAPPAKLAKDDVLHRGRSRTRRRRDRRRVEGGESGGAAECCELGYTVSVMAISDLHAAAAATRREQLLLARSVGYAGPVSGLPDKLGAIDAAAQVFADHAIDYALIGGLAVGIRSGVPRATLDVDFAIATHVDRKASLPGSWTEDFSSSASSPTASTSSTTAANPFSSHSMPRSIPMIERAQAVQLGETWFCVSSPSRT